MRLTGAMHKLLNVPKGEMKKKQKKKTNKEKGKLVYKGKLTQDIDEDGGGTEGGYIYKEQRV